MPQDYLAGVYLISIAFTDVCSYFSSLENVPCIVGKQKDQGLRRLRCRMRQAIAMARSIRVSRHPVPGKQASSGL